MVWTAKGCILAVLSLILGGFAVAQSPVVPLETTVHFHPDVAWSAPLRDKAGKVEYLLSLDPQRDLHGHVVMVELVLHRPGDASDSPNLLYDGKNLHGAQPFTFDAIDLQHGVELSGFGAERTIRLESIKMQIMTRLLGASVRTASGRSFAGTPEIASLDLFLRLSSLAPSLAGTRGRTRPVD